MGRFNVVVVEWLAASLVMIMLLAAAAQTTYADNKIFVSTSTQNKVVSFNVTSGSDSPPIYGFIVIIDNGHYSKITESPAGWSGGTIKYQAIIWSTKSDPLQPGSSEGEFAIEVTQKGTYTISWSATDSTLQPVAWGSVTIKVT